LEETCASEVALWRRAHKQFKASSPYELMPISDEITTGFIDMGIPPNMPNTFCRSFCKFLCCDGFEKSSQFVKYAVECALKERLGEEAPDRSEAVGNRNGPIVGKLRRNIRASGRRTLDSWQEDMLANTLDKILGKDLPEHQGFLSYLPNAVKESRHQGAKVRMWYQTNQPRGSLMLFATHGMHMLLTIRISIKNFVALQMWRV
jgi:hypothetical protein